MYPTSEESTSSERRIEEVPAEGAFGPRRVVAYIDGFNLYYGIKDGWRRHRIAAFKDCYWLDLEKLIRRRMHRDDVLVRVKYYTARVLGRLSTDDEERGRANEVARLRQADYLEALAANPLVEIREGRFLDKTSRCFACGGAWSKPEEKGSDVALATDLVADAFLNAFDKAVVVSGDSDLAPPLAVLARHFPRKQLLGLFPPGRRSLELERVGGGVWRKLRLEDLRRCQLPEEVEVAPGVVLRRPGAWTRAEAERAIAERAEGGEQEEQSGDAGARTVVEADRGPAPPVSAV